ncbi:hypothetical protein N7G274_010470 [Stereocaulon virgatum]|uniref:HCP-like protein n=1 Tax=Stereocaulon virgatum TaxID=373712 RepID=A0ABR3ZXL7_9LECA
MATKSNGNFSTFIEVVATDEKSPPTAARSPSSYSLSLPQGQNDPDPGPSIDVLETNAFSTSCIGTLARTRGQVLSSTHSKGPLNGKARSFQARKVSSEAERTGWERKASQGSVNRDQEQDGSNASQRWNGTACLTQIIREPPRLTTKAVQSLNLPHLAVTSLINEIIPTSRRTSGGSFVSRLSRHVSGGNLLDTSIQEEAPESPQYHHQSFEVVTERRAIESSSSRKVLGRVSYDTLPLPGPHVGPSAHLEASLPRPSPTYSSESERTFNQSRFAGHYSCTPSSSRHLPDPEPKSNADLLGASHEQSLHTPESLNNVQLRLSVGEEIASLSTKRALDIHRSKAKTTTDATVQHEFALALITAAAETGTYEQNGDHRGVDGAADSAATTSRRDLLREARLILQRLSDRSYTPAQYYLADGYASGFFNEGQEDNDHAFPLFISASKQGHVEAGYRAALCYEFGWGCRKDIRKAVRFYRQSASRNHPGAMSRLGRACLTHDKSLGNRRSEGVRWLRRAAESADLQYNWAPYDLGILYATGYGDHLFQDEPYAVQLFTQSAGLGHAEANYVLGQAYELGNLSCPRSPALSIHFYTGAAQRGHRLAMLALCAWYMVGAEPVLKKDENKACRWAKQAAESGKISIYLRSMSCAIHPLSLSYSAPIPLLEPLTPLQAHPPPATTESRAQLNQSPGLAKAQYAIGYFTEMGVGCQRDLHEASVWYFKAALQGDDRAKGRLAAIQAMAEGGGSVTAGVRTDTERAKGNEGKKRKRVLFWQGTSTLNGEYVGGLR